MRTEQITAYVAEDGTRFFTEAACDKYERETLAVPRAMAPLGPAPDPELRTGHWIQHSREACLAAKRALFAIIRERICPSWVGWETPVDEIHPMSFIGRAVDDSSHQEIKTAMNRLQRIDWNSFREHQQPYFALNPRDHSIQAEPDEVRTWEDPNAPPPETVQTGGRHLRPRRRT